MKLKATDLTQHLKRSLQPLYIICGDELLLVQEAADIIRNAAREAGYTNRRVLTVESDFKWSQLAESAASLSLFDNKNFTELRIPSGKPGNEGAQALQEYCGTFKSNAVDQHTVTLILLPKLDKAAQTSKWFSAVETNGVAIMIYPVERNRLPQWIAERLALQGQHAAADALQFLAEQVEGNLLAAHQEIQKLGLLFAPGALSFEQIKSAVLDVARFDVFNLSDALLAGDTGRALKILESLKAEGLGAPLVLWAIAREIRALATLQSKQRSGISTHQAMRDLRIWDSRQSLTENALRRLSGSDIKLNLIKTADIDLLAKGLGKGDVWHELSELCVSLTRASNTQAAI